MCVPWHVHSQIYLPTARRHACLSFSSSSLCHTFSARTQPTSFDNLPIQTHQIQFIMSKSRIPLILGLTAAGGAGYYLYGAGGNAKAAENKFESTPPAPSAPVPIR